MKNLYQEITDRFINEMKKGVIPWRKPWINAAGKGAFSRGTGKPYSFMNQMLLAAYHGGDPSGEWATFGQWKKDGGRVKAGEKAAYIVFFEFNRKPVLDENGDPVKDENGSPVTRSYPVLKEYAVFHISQVDGVEPKHAAPVEYRHEPVAMAESIMKYYYGRESLKLTHADGNRAFYRPFTDSVNMPESTQFKSVSEYYSTWFHETVHSTGAVNRLNRITDAATFGNEPYAKEELVAEIGAAALVNYCGIETPESFENSAAYIQSWIKALKNDKTLLVSAAGKAEKAVNFILDGYTAPIDTPDNTDSENESVPEKPVKKARRSSDQVIVDRLMKAAMKDDSSAFNGYHPVDINGETFNAFTDGHIILAVKGETFGYSVAEKPITLLSDLCTPPFSTNEYEFDLGKLKAAKKAYKNEPYIFESSMPCGRSSRYFECGINPAYSIDAINFTHNNKCEFEYKHMYSGSCNVSPYYFIGKGRLAVVLPINVDNI